MPNSTQPPLNTARFRPYTRSSTKQRKEVIQCLTRNAVTSLGSPANAISFGITGAPAPDQRVQTTRRGGSNPAALFCALEVQALLLPEIGRRPAGGTGRHAGRGVAEDAVVAERGGGAGDRGRVERQIAVGERDRAAIGRDTGGVVADHAAV